VFSGISVDLDFILEPFPLVTGEFRFSDYRVAYSFFKLPSDFGLAASRGQRNDYRLSPQRMPTQTAFRQKIIVRDIYNIRFWT
jgi:hypothetical protein